MSPIVVVVAGNSCTVFNRRAFAKRWPTSLQTVKNLFLIINIPPETNWSSTDHWLVPDRSPIAPQWNDQDVYTPKQTSFKRSLNSHFTFCSYIQHLSWTCLHNLSTSFSKYYSFVNKNTTILFFHWVYNLSHYCILALFIPLITSYLYQLSGIWLNL